MKKAKKKKVVKKTREGKMVDPPGPPVTPFEYFIDEVPTTLSTQEMQNRSNQLGVDGWQLLFVGEYSSTPNSLRVWYMRR